MYTTASRGPPFLAAENVLDDRRVGLRVVARERCDIDWFKARVARHDPSFLEARRRDDRHLGLTGDVELIKSAVTVHDPRRLGTQPAQGRRP